MLLAHRVVVLAAGRLQQVIDVDLPDARTDPARLRALPGFAHTRLALWQALHTPGRHAAPA